MSTRLDFICPNCLKFERALNHRETWRLIQGTRAMAVKMLKMILRRPKLTRNLTTMKRAMAIPTLFFYQYSCTDLQKEIRGDSAHASISAMSPVGCFAEVALIMHMTENHLWVDVGKISRKRQWGLEFSATSSDVHIFGRPIGSEHHSRRFQSLLH
jgi:hypothetical protein